MGLKGDSIRYFYVSVGIFLALLLTKVLYYLKKSNNIACLSAVSVTLPEYVAIILNQYQDVWFLDNASPRKRPSLGV